MSTENRKIIYYTDELNEEFSTAKIKPRVIDENYKYIHKNPLWNFCSYALQNFISMPIKVLYQKIKFKLKYVGKEKLKPYKKQGYFIYVNHTQPFADTFIPSVAVYPKRNFLIVNPENVSMKGMHTLVEMLGAIPIPSNKEAMKNFLETIEKRIKSNYSITIYPEAHIWPYYTKIRPFKPVSFKYPVKLDTPVFCMTNTYQSYGKKNIMKESKRNVKSKNKSYKEKIKIVTYIDGPFFANKELTPKEQQQDLRNRVYNCMVERSKNSNIEHIKYVKSQK